MNQIDIECEQCPYDKSHMILKCRMLTHLAKCAKNFPDSEKTHCAFNKKHIVPVPELKYHHHSCPDRIKFDMFKMKVGDVECAVKNEVPIPIDMPESEENWDDDTQVVESVLNSIQDIGDKDIISTINVIGKSKKKRKEMRRMEILRHSLFKSDYSAVQTYNRGPERKLMDNQSIRVPKDISNISSQLHQRLNQKKNDESVNSVASSASGVHMNKNPLKSKSSVCEEGIAQLSDNMKSVNISNASDCSVSSRKPAPIDSKSYATLLAERQKQEAAIKQRGLNNRSQEDEDGKYKMQVLNVGNGFQNAEISQYFENSPPFSFFKFSNGPRGRGKPALLNIEHPVSNATPRSSNSTSYSSVSSSLNFETDEHGFLHMPVPGKGRGQIYLCD